MGDTYFRKYTCILQENLNGTERDFPGGPVVKDPPANTGDRGWIPAPGRSHMPWGS